MTSLMTSERRPWPTLTACAIAGLPALVFSVVWVLTRDSRFDSTVMLATFVAALLYPGWVGWVALRARSTLVVAGIAVAASLSGPAIQLIFVGGGRLTRVLIYGWIGWALLAGILVAMMAMRRGGSIAVLTGWVLGTIAMNLVLLPLLFLLLFPRPIL